MSSSSLFNANDYNIYCNEMHCKNMIPSGTGNPGDILTVDNTGKSVFSKTFQGNNQNYRFENSQLRVINTNDTTSSVLSVGTLSTNNQGAVLGIGEEDTQNSWFYYYDPTSKNLGMSQNNACVNHDFNINLGTGNLNLDGNLRLNGKLKDSAGADGSAGQYLASNGSNVTWTNLPTDTVSSVFGRTGAVVAQEGDYSLDQLSDVTLAGINTNQILNYNGTWQNSNTSMYREKISSNNSTFTASLDNIYTAPGGIVTLPNTGISDEGRRILMTTANSQNLNIIFPLGSFLMNTGQSNFVITTSNGGIELIVVSPNQWVALAIGGDWNGISNTGFISAAFNGTPGAYNVIVPTGARKALISAVGAGGGGANIGGSNGLGGGGAGGAIVDFPVGVTAGQTISIAVGAGGGNNTNGGDTTINMGSFIITCSGGQAGQFANPIGNGGNGGSVILPMATTTGGLGGVGAIGSNGVPGYFTYSGAGGGSGVDGGPSFSGGALLLNIGGSANSRQGGGGASAFGNGGSYNVAPGGIRGSGGPGNVNGIVNGGDGFVDILFYS